MGVIMKNSTTHRNHSRAKFARFGKIVSAAAFGLLIGAFAIGPVQADGHHGGDHGDRGRGHEERHEYRGRGYDRGPDYAYGNPDYYYAPAPDYYYQPDPYEYGYYPPGPRYYAPGPSEGIRQFFGL
jgi:hypothetical protein